MIAFKRLHWSWLPTVLKQWQDCEALYLYKCSNQWESFLRKNKALDIRTASYARKERPNGEDDLFVLTPSYPPTTSLSSFRYICTSCLNLINTRCYYLRKSKLPLPVLMNYCTKCVGIWEQDRFINECLIKGTVTEFLEGWGEMFLFLRKIDTFYHKMKMPYIQYKFKVSQFRSGMKS